MDAREFAGDEPPSSATKTLATLMAVASVLLLVISAFAAIVVVGLSQEWGAESRPLAVGLGMFVIALPLTYLSVVTAVRASRQSPAMTSGDVRRRIYLSASGFALWGIVLGLGGS